MPHMGNFKNQYDIETKKNYKHLYDTYIKYSLFIFYLHLNTCYLTNDILFM